jgi:hypothetical protein
VRGKGWIACSLHSTAEIICLYPRPFAPDAATGNKV